MINTEIETEGFSRRVVMLLRERLRAYHLYEVPTDGEQSWDNVSEEISSLTGVSIPGESLRQNVTFKNKSRGAPARRSSDERWRAIRDFLVHPTIGYLHEIELTRLSLSLHPLLSLQEFFGISVRDDRPGVKLEPTGIFFAEIESATDVEEIELIINYESKTAISEVLQISVLTDMGRENDFWDRRTLDGFSVYSEQGVYLIVLRDALTRVGSVKLVLEAEVVQSFAEKDGEQVMVDEHIHSFTALENQRWIPALIDARDQSKELTEKSFGVSLVEFSTDVLKYFRTDVSKLTLDGE